MNPFTMLWTDLRSLVVDTGRVWWRLLPQLMAIYLLGWLGFQLALKLAAVVGDKQAWISLVIFAFAFLSRLTALILMLRLAGRELHIKDMIPPDERDDAVDDERISHLLAVTLLPFLGIYAAFGEVNAAANQLVTEQLARTGAFASENWVLTIVGNAAMDHPWIFAACLVGLYALRRGLDLAHEKTGWRALGLAVAFVESFFMLVVIMGGIRIWQSIKLWLDDRAFLGWLAAVRNWLTDLLSVIKIDLPAVLTALGDLFREQVWPTLTEVVTQPIIWLAVAALVYGSNVLSIAEMWRKGKPIASRAPGAKRIAKVTARIPVGGAKPPRTVARLGIEFKEAFLGDLDDKYMPTFHSIRLVLRAGVIFLGAFVLVYAILDILENYLRMFTLSIVGGHDVEFWMVTSPFFDLIYDLPFEPLRISLLAVAFHRCLQLFMAKAQPADRAAELPQTVAVRGTA